MQDLYLYQSIFTLLTDLCLPPLLLKPLLPSETSESIWEVSVQINTVIVVPEIDQETEKHGLTCNWDLTDSRDSLDDKCSWLEVSRFVIPS